MVARETEETLGRDLDAAIQGSEMDTTDEQLVQPSPPVLGTSASPEASSLTSKSRRMSPLLSGLVLILIVLVFWLATLYVWLLSHGVRLEKFLAPDEGFLQTVAEFDFLGVSLSNPQPSILSLNYEIVMWSIFAVAIRTMFRISVALSRKRFDFLRYFGQWIGDMVMAAGLAEVVILFLRIARFNVGGANLTLAEANYETIAALAFILGFYNEDTRRLLSRFRTRIVSAASSPSSASTPSEEDDYW